jgi:probable rRNA maturation factor
LAALFASALRRVPKAYRLAAAKGCPLAVDVHIVGDERIAELNAAHLGHACTTDVLSFSMGEVDPERRAYHVGEIVANYAIAAREAAARRIAPAEELTRYCLHGWLHLLGYEDGSAAERKTMERVQEDIMCARYSTRRRRIM